MESYSNADAETEPSIALIHACRRDGERLTLSGAEAHASGARGPGELATVGLYHPTETGQPSFAQPSGRSIHVAESKIS